MKTYIQGIKIQGIKKEGVFFRFEFGFQFIILKIMKKISTELSLFFVYAKYHDIMMFGRSNHYQHLNSKYSPPKIFLSVIIITCNITERNILQF